MKINEKKLARQEYGANNWRYARGIGGFMYPTGMGKTFTALYCIVRRMLLKSPTYKVQIVVPFDNLRTQWRNEIEKLIPEWQDNINVETVHTILANGLIIDVELLIIDEADEFYGSERKKIWNGTMVRFKYFLWLSAELKDKQGRHKEFLDAFPVVDEVTEAEAIDNGWVSPYTIYNYGVDLSQEERDQYDNYTEKINNYLAKFDGKFNVAKYCLSGYVDKDSDPIIEKTAFECATRWATKMGWNSTVQQIAEGKIPVAEATRKNAIDICSQWSPNVIIGYSKELFKATRERNALLHKAVNKKDAFVQIVRKFPKKKIIGFGQSVPFAEEIAAVCNKLTPTVVYHSQMESKPLRSDIAGNPSLFGNGPFITYKSGKKKDQPKLFGKTILRRLTIEAFLTNLARVCVSASALDKGANFPDIEVAIVTSNTSNPNQFLQRKGRATRFIKGKKAIIICVYAKYTKEVTTLARLQRSNDSEVYFINHLDDIGKASDAINHLSI